MEGNSLYSIDPDGVEYKYVRDDNGNLVLFEDGHGNDYTFSYDQNGLQNSSGYPDGTSTKFTYDDEGHLMSLVNPDNSTINFSYDDEDNLVRFSSHYAYIVHTVYLNFYVQIYRSSLDSETHFEYDTNRLLISAYNDHSRASIVYNQEGLPGEVRYSSGHTLYYGYNGKGQRTFLADNHGYNISYLYDMRSRLVEVQKSNDSSLISRFVYSDGVVVRKILGNGAYTTYAYNEDRKLVHQANYLPDHTLSSSNQYDYDQKGRVTRIADSANRTWSYKYDITGQLTGWTSSTGEDVSFSYDTRGNRLMMQMRNSRENYFVNNMNQYTSYNGTEQFLYDLNGNLIRKVTPRGTESYEFDAEGRLIHTETTSNR